MRCSSGGSKLVTVLVVEEDSLLLEDGPSVGEAHVVFSTPRGVVELVGPDRR